MVNNCLPDTLPCNSKQVIFKPLSKDPYPLIDLFNTEIIIHNVLGTEPSQMLAQPVLINYGTHNSPTEHSEN